MTQRILEGKWRTHAFRIQGKPQAGWELVLAT